ncbi:zinc-binding alcohol dehydrogenase domain-containing protein 2, variant [Capsaspora owczarzaki ATCC 30864]|uniref:zinc-binding alcohol dehydrogenase domain-containing protein 2, variant n=1 Tax=Capsaspora owczarzaki (strain ATCC 30864) TaxID=595528 RepID=UPI0003523246|nr:zinc-binding alcohol dehydrogenase domain-containing protein 2, variant [Capsaspora owczarzaki ATCC 30864]|eukprot:XP_011270497.1 zinc-binding alcohol dehydrogenase domain-containing protein 2, variant [Capsaspora owczarzaki ATCC 30864]
MLASASASAAAPSASASSVPARVIQVQQLTADFRAAVAIVEQPIPLPLKPNHVLIRNRFLGINASDINFTAGRYNPTVKPPFSAGFEALGVVEHVGADVSHLRVGDAVVYMADGSFSEVISLAAARSFKVPSLDPAYLTCLVSGLTASIALEECGEIKNGEKVLVTAAAGGTGLWAVQLAALQGCKVYGTASSTDKVELLNSLNCHGINYKTQNLKDVLKAEAPTGIDVVYESVGGSMFDTALGSLAQRGRLIVIGYITSYADPSAAPKPTLDSASICRILLGKSCSIRGFFLMQYTDKIKAHLEKLIQLVADKKVKGFVDSRKFVGLEAVADAVEYLHTGKSAGKVVVELPAQ